ncbi:MAG: M4 family peptidase [Gemmatimonadaceae bacterium]|nr:M4 family peptidase [Gloeobacterales cyanobacterium ES-bin-141]
MKALKSSLCNLVGTCLSLGLLVAASSPANAVGRTGQFKALSGEQARAFQVPADVQLTRSSTAYGLNAERYQQRHGVARVLGGQITVYRDASGAATTVIGAHYPNLQPRNRVRLNLAQARTAAEGKSRKAGAWKGELLIDPTTNLYVWQVENRGAYSRWFYRVDAQSGKVLKSYNGLTNGSGTGVKGDIKDLTGLTTFQGSSYIMQSNDARQVTYDALNRRAIFLKGVVGTDTDDIWDTPGTASPGQPALVDAHFYARVTDNYYQAKFSFNWLTAYPQGMVSLAHVRRDYNNAFWNGTQMAYGDGDGVNFIELSGDLDVVGHELSHGLTEATSNLVYDTESGALNESFSDILGTLIEFDYGSGNWTIGEDVTPGDNGIRNMANPNEDGQPSHYADLYTGSDDNGGVHINSGIPNHWFYLLVNGGQNAKPERASGTNVTSISLASAEQIAFLSFTGLPETANFCDARSATIATATSLGVQNNTADAWDEVGVDSALCGS